MHITYDLPVAIDDIIEAKQRLAGRIYKTGMPRSNYFSERCKGEIFLKFENMQRTGSFKIRGAFNKLSSLTDAEKRKGVVACSAGNHAQGVSLSCAMLGIDGKVVMPKGAPKSKVAATCDYSAEVVLHGDNFNDTIAKVSEIVEMEGRIFIPPYDDPKVIAAKLHEIEDRERTHGQPKVIGSLYGFDIVVKTDTTVKDGLDFCENRFFVRGEGNFLYNYNNGRLAIDPKTACQNFINAFDSIPRLIEKYTRDNEAIEKELPVLEQVVEEVWKKEDELKQLKADLAALDRKILLSLKSVDTQEKNNDGVIEVVPSQPVTPDGQDNAPAAGIPVADAPPGSSSPGSVPTQDTPPAEPYVHRMPDFLADRQRTPPKLSGMPKSISIKEAMGAPGGKLVIGGVPKSGNKDDPDPDRPEKPKPKLKL